MNGRSKKTTGYLLGAAAAASYGLNPTFALPLYSDGMNPDSVLLLRYGLAIPMVAIMILLRGRSIKIPRQSILPIAVLGILMALSSLTLFISYNYMAAGIATLTVTFWVLLFGSTLFVGRLSAGASELVLPSTWYLWVDAAALAVFPTVISLVCTTRAIQIIGSTPTAILGAIEPVTAVIMGILLFDEGMNADEAFGIALILVAVSFVVAGAPSRNAISKHLTRFRQMFPKR